MSEYSDSKSYGFPVLEEQDGALRSPRVSASCSSMPRGAPGCSSMAPLHQMGGYSQGGPELDLPSDSSSQDPPNSPHSNSNNARSLPEDDVEMKSNGSSGSGTESHGNESHGHGHESAGSSNGNSKDSALLESSESNKRLVMAVGMFTPVVVSAGIPLVCLAGMCPTKRGSKDVICFPYFIDSLSLFWQLSYDCEVHYP